VGERVISGRYRDAALAAFIMVAAVASPCCGEEISKYVATMQIHDDSSGITSVVFQTADSKKLCEALNTAYWRGVQTTCPTCKREMYGCDRNLPSGYVGIFSNRPLVFPYVSGPYTRIVMLGAPLAVVRSACEEMAAKWRAATHEDVKCILP
jgi:hypothetical protein